MTSQRGSEQSGCFDFDYTAAVYDYLRSLGAPGDEVMTSIRPWLERTYDLGYSDAARVRRSAMTELTAQGKIERLNTRGRYVRILG
ncbi:hypothetical protein CFI00_09785 [Nocardioides sp. S5]|nr:hypothetical protein CFI00_09785 [Nocardioides sp. S5]